MRTERRSWIHNYLSTVVTSLVISGIVGFTTVAYGFTQSTIQNEATLKQQVTILDTTLKQYMATNEKILIGITSDTQWIKERLNKVIVATAVLESKED